MSESTRDYTSLGLIIPESIAEQARILKYIRDNESNKDKIGYADISYIETDDIFIEFQSMNTGVYKPSEITNILKENAQKELTDVVELEKAIRSTIELSESGIRINWDTALKTIPTLSQAFLKVKNLQGIPRLTLKEVLQRCLELKKNLTAIKNIMTLEECLRIEGFKFKLIEAVSKWDDRNENWSITSDKQSFIDIDDLKKEIGPAGYLAMDDVLEYYEDNYLVEIQDELDTSMENMTKEQKIETILERDAFNDSTGYYEWSQEELNKAIFKVLKREATQS